MSKEKISIPEIVDLVVQNRNITKKTAEEFIKTMLSIIEDALIEGDTVKIKGLGTFKPQWNEARKSVDVNSGNEIIIPGYYKVAFTPENELRDLINEPFAHLQKVELENQTDSVDNEMIISDEKKEPAEPMRIFEEQAQEIKNLLTEIGAISTKNEFDTSVTEVEVLVAKSEDEIPKSVIITETELSNDEPEAKITGLLHQNTVNDIVDDFEVKKVEKNQVQHQASEKNIEKEHSKVIKSKFDLSGFDIIRDLSVKSGEASFDEDDIVAETQKVTQISEEEIEEIPTVIEMASEIKNDFPTEEPLTGKEDIETVEEKPTEIEKIEQLEEEKPVETILKDVDIDEELDDNFIVSEEKIEDGATTVAAATEITPEIKDDYLVEEPLTSEEDIERYEEKSTETEISQTETEKLAETIQKESDAKIEEVHETITEEVEDNSTVPKVEIVKEVDAESIHKNTDNQPIEFVSETKDATGNDDENVFIKRNRSLEGQPLSTGHENEEDESHKKYRFWYYILIPLWILAVALLAAWYFYPDLFKMISKRNDIKIEYLADSVAHVQLISDSLHKMEIHKSFNAASNDSTQRKDSIVKSQTTANIFDLPRVYNETVATVEMKKGSQLSRFAREYYGHPDFWVYIYEANKELSKNPDSIPLGAKLKIPKVDARLINPKSKECIEFAKKLQNKYLN